MVNNNKERNPNLDGILEKLPKVKRLEISPAKQAEMLKICEDYIHDTGLYDKLLQDYKED